MEGTGAGACTCVWVHVCSVFVCVCVHMYGVCVCQWCVLTCAHVCVVCACTQGVHAALCTHECTCVLLCVLCFMCDCVCTRRSLHALRTCVYMYVFVCGSLLHGTCLCVHTCGAAVVQEPACVCTCVCTCAHVCGVFPHAVCACVCVHMCGARVRMCREPACMCTCAGLNYKARGNRSACRGCTPQGVDGGEQLGSGAEDHAGGSPRVHCPASGLAGRL